MISKDGLWEYNKKRDGSLSVMGYKGDGVDVTVPAEIDGMRVTRIGDGAFSRSESMNIDRMKITNTRTRSVVVSEGIKQIGNWSFLGLPELAEVVLPNGLEEIGEKAFERCCSLRGIEIPYSVKNLCSSCFADCTDLKKVCLPDGLKVISDYLFCGCAGLEEVVIPESVEIIGNGAFYGCSSLKKLGLPSSEIKIGDRAFDGCGLLDFISYGNCFYFGNRDNPYRILISVSDRSVNSVVISPDTEIVSSAAFSRCRELTEIIMRQGVKIIGSGAFEGCVKLSSVIIPDTVSSIGTSAFAGCSSLRSMFVPSSVTEIQPSAFAKCERLEKITVDGKNVRIHPTSFDGCSALSRIVAPNVSLQFFPSALKPILSVGFIAERNRVTFREEIADGYRSYIKREFERHVPYSYTIPEVADYLSSGGLLSLDRTDSLIDDERTSTECRAILMNYRENGFSAEEKNSKLDREMGFRDYTEDELKTLWSFSENGDGTLTVIAYKGHDTDVTVPDFVGDRMVTAISDMVFSPQKSRISSERKAEIIKIKSVTVPDTVTKFSDGVFLGSSVETVNLPRSMTFWGADTFGGCVSLRSVRIPDGLTVLPRGTFSCCKELTEIAVPEGVTEIGPSAFAYCIGLKKVSIPEGVKKIVFDTFTYCSGLERLELPASIVSIYGITCERHPCLTVVSPEGSCAEAYAKNNGIKYSEK